MIPLSRAVTACSGSSDPKMSLELRKQKLSKLRMQLTTGAFQTSRALTAHLSMAYQSENRLSLMAIT